MSKFQQADTRDDKTTDVWLTPPAIISALTKNGMSFDLDPAYSLPRPIETADRYYGETEDGLAQEWCGSVFCNPPYGKAAGLFVKKCKEHGDSVVLTFARTETRWWHDHVWNSASGILFFKGRLKFISSVTLEAGDASPAPSALIAYGDSALSRLKDSELVGKLIIL